VHFLIVLIAVVVLESNGQLAFIQRDIWVRKWYSALSGLAGLKSDSLVKILVFVLLPVVALQIVLWSLGDGVLVFLLELAVLLYSFGRGDLRAQIAVLESDIERSDLQAAFHDAAVFNIGHRSGSADSAAGLCHELAAALPYRLFERTFAAVFWFFILGAPAALAYRLLALHGDMELGLPQGNQIAEESETEQEQAELEPKADQEQTVELADSANQLLWYLEWLPARFLALTLGLMGDFSRATTQLKDLVFCAKTSTADLLRRCVLGALNGDVINISAPNISALNKDDAESESQTADLAMIPEVVALFRRSMTGWLVVIALFVLIS
jgi:AmpE protein